MNRRLGAAIDLGTNTARLLIGSVDENGMEQHLLMRRITRLGGGFSETTGISGAAQERTLAAIREFAATIRQHDVEYVKAVATSAVRDAINGPEFCAAIRAQTGLSFEVIDGQSEGLLTLEGVRMGLDKETAQLMVFDVGGGSTEYTVAQGELILATESLPLGVVRLSEGKVTTTAMIDKIDRELLQHKSHLAEKSVLPARDRCTLIGTAGTATTLAAISLRMTDYDYRRVNNHLLALKEIRDIFERLLPLEPAERLLVPGLEKGREDLIIAGTLITLRTMEIFGFEELKVSDFGLLEGVLLAGARRC
jgi:exopolyphosphatase / guanosine-5'-triphosphate,3'-diphosphate pyrophosphatase